ncbi:hypothetical protein C1H76_9214 [Elsinoe australis]|uniref:Spc7 kinetochore protein domain-containing protein n=1 Tax=Elsinoe australis TaxID=40998 RepID=A0A4U7ANJ2_9PEZI|nr:hypothetical protein C1H76_9214 [Elsinoe australis]
MAEILNKENLSPNRQSVSPSKTIGSSPVKVSRKGRSKSIGPTEGILEQQKPTASPNKNRRKSSFAPAPKSILPSKEDEAKRREARRKSLANRRVSFAPEATLHTWDVIEYMREATTSSTSSGDSRRTSRSDADDQTSDPVDVPSTPDANASPARKKRRRSSAIPPLNFNDPDEDFSSSPVSGSSPIGDSGEESDGMDEVEDDEDDDSSAMSLVSAENTADLTAQSDMSSGTSDSSARLDAALRQASELAGTRGIEYDEYGYNSDQGGEDEEEEQEEEPLSIARQQVMLTPLAKNLIAFQDQENVNPFSPAFRAVSGRPSTIAEEEEDDNDLSMDMTRAVGGIVGFKQPEMSTDDATMDFTQVAGKIYQPSPFKNALKRRRSTAETGSPMPAGADSQQSEMGRPSKRRRSSADRSSMGDGTMDFTAAFGAIDGPGNNKDMTMEFTTAIGNIIRSQSPIKVSRRQSVRRRRSSAQSVMSNDQTMDFTMAVGAIQQNQESPLKSVSQIAEEDESEEMNGDSNEDISMEMTAALGNVMEEVQVPPRPTTPSHLSSPLREDPPTTPKDQGRFKEAGDLSAKKKLTPVFMKEAGVSPLPSSVSVRKSPASAQKMTPVGRASLSPTRTLMALPAPKSPAVRTPSASPQRSLYPELPEAKSVLTPTPSPSKKAASVHATPRTPNTPVTPERKSSPIKKLESPFKHARDTSIKPEQPVSPARASPQRTQTNMLDSIRAMSTPRKDNNATPLTRLKEMTPKKTPLSKARTPRAVTTPRVQFTAPSPSPSAQLNAEFLQSLSTSQHAQQKVTLNAFLNAAGIKFMDLTASKRRYTAAPTPSKRAQFSATEHTRGQDEASAFVEAVVASACTVPELDLYAHACRELKRYMAEGRTVLKQLEKDVEAEAPAFMAAYLGTGKEGRAKMDTVLGDMKTKARMGSKEVWYGWRKELLGGLEGGLREVERGLEGDEKELAKREEAVNGLSEREERREQLEREVAALKEVVEREREEDPEALEEARQQLLEVDAAVSEQRALLEQLQQELEEQERLAELYVDSKTEAQSAIEEANRVKEACRGISVEEVAAYQASVASLEAATNWRISTATGSSLTLNYRNDLQLFFSPTSFGTAPTTPSRRKSRSPRKLTNAPISLTYIADSQAKPSPLTTEKRFFLQMMRAHLQMVDQSATSVKSLLNFVAQGWEIAISASETIRRLKLQHPVDVKILSDEALGVDVSMLLPDVQTKVTLSFEIGASIIDGEKGIVLETAVETKGRVVYGEQYKEGKMGEFLGQRTGRVLQGAEKAVAELKVRLEKTGRKG